MFLLGATGILLAWKNELKIMPPTVQSTVDNQNPISLDSIQQIALVFIKDSLKLDAEINRIDYRPSKGVAKIRFENHFTELQLDVFSGEIVSVKHRTADLIEMIHDGSIMDYLFGTKNDALKLFYSTLTSLGLMLLSISGFFLWFFPKKIKSIKSKVH